MQRAVREDPASGESTEGRGGAPEPHRPVAPPVPVWLGWTRVAWRAPRLVAWTGALFGVWVTVGTLLHVWPTGRRGLRARLFRTWGRRLVGVLGFEVEVRGRPPAAPCFVVSNHVSWVDIPLIASQFEGAFVAKAEIGGWPVAGRLSRSMNTIFVDRARRRDVVRVNELVHEVLRDGLGVVVFPEGGSTRGAAVERFNSSLLEPATVGDYDVVATTVRYEAPDGAPPPSRTVCFWGEISFGEHALQLLQQPAGYRAILSFDPEPVRERDRKRLARRLHAAISEAFEPIA